MRTILFVAHGSGVRCGGYDFGKRWLSHIQNTEKYTWIYAEVNNLAEFDAKYREVSPDAVIFNFVPIAMGWVSSLVGEVLDRYPVPRIVMEHNWSEGIVSTTLNNHFPTFTYLMMSDPSFTVADSRVFNFSRPLHAFTPEELHLDPTEEVRIGSFGFALPHKNFPLLVREVNRTFENATLNLHVTAPTFGEPLLEPIMAQCRAEITKPGIKLNHTSDFCSEEEAISRLSKNHINALFYMVPDHNSGLSSSMDFFLAAQRPMLLSDCAVFNHLRSVMCQYPQATFTDMLGNLAHIETAVQDYYQSLRGQLNSEAETMMDSVFLQGAQPVQQS